jgi:signal transduction histidine kinase
MGLQRIELEADELRPEHRELAASMRQAVKRTNTIVSDLLRYSRPMTARRDPVNLAQLIDTILLLYKPQCEGKNISVSRHGQLAQAVPGDAELLGQLFENIIKNAVEAQAAGGYISVTSIMENNQARISIDNAMPRGSVDNLSQLLEPYFTTKTRGTGLGLPIARRIAQAHEGSLELAVPEQDIFRAVITLPLVGCSGG